MTNLEGLLSPLGQLMVIFRPPTHTTTMWVTYFHQNNTWESLLGSEKFLSYFNLIPSWRWLILALSKVGYLDFTMEIKFRLSDFMPKNPTWHVIYT